ncbi:MAG: putative hydrolase of the alpha/beta superfamily protein [Planctomycetaceae bacterium]|nr:putative hydrolase of the alpha/beta superfamily protein [Planctomycetaceae bacterium]
MDRTLSGTWQQIEIAGKKADIFEPATPSDTGAVIFLHGHGEITLSGNAIYSRNLAQQGLRVICPHGKRSWWLDRVCQEFDPLVTPERYILDDVLPWMESTWNVQKRQAALFGVSMGGQGSLRIAYRHALRFPVVAALSPVIDLNSYYGHGLPLDQIYPDAETARQESATLQINPLNWPKNQWLSCDPQDSQAFEGVVRLASKLSSSGIPFDGDRETSRGGHSWDYFNYQAPKVTAWLADRLKYESLRA